MSVESLEWAGVRRVEGLAPSVALPEVTVGDNVPLTAAYCAERAARALHEAETAPEIRAEQLFKAAHAWRHLGEAIGSVQAMNRPKPDDGDTSRRARR